MKEITVNYTATIEKTLTVPDDFYEKINEVAKNGQWFEVNTMLWCLMGYADLEKKGIYINDLQSIYDTQTEETIVEF